MNQSITLEELKPDKFEEAFEIIKACSKELDKQGLTHWSEFYSDLDKFRNSKDNADTEVFIIKIDGEPAATVTLSSKPPKYFTNPEFGDIPEFMQFFTKIEPVDAAIYISALGVAPKFQGRGLAKAILSKIEEIAKGIQIKAIRFDTRAEFAPAVRLYNSMGYKIVFTDKISDTENYHFYEKVLS